MAEFQAKNKLVNADGLQKVAQGVYTKAKTYTDTKVSEEITKIINGAPETFDTLKEIADWIENDKGATDLLERVDSLEDAIGNPTKVEEDLTTPATGLNKLIEDEVKRAKSAEAANTTAISTLRTDVITTFSDLDLNFTETTEGKAAVQLILSTGNQMGGEVTTPISDPVELPVMTEEEINNLIINLS